MKLYEPSDVNYYIMDFGAEVLKAYSNSIYVGDIIGLGDDDKIKNLYKLINSEIERRKVLFSNYGGSYTDYLKKNNNKIPRLVIVLNNYEAYQDSYEVYTDTLNTLTRDCSKFGIYFIMTCNTPNGMRFKLKQNFSNIFCLNQNNEDDYSAILGNVNKNYPSKNFGRGIIKGNMVYEFQTASVDVKEKINDTIDEIIDEVKDKYKYKAKKIPTLPKVVDYEYVREYIDNTLNMVIGVEKNSLDIYKYNFKKNFIDVISASDSSLLSRFANSFIAQLKLVKNISIITIAAEDYDIDSNLRSGMVYEENNLNDIYDKFKNYVDECYKIFESNNFNQASLMNQTPIMLVINGLESFKSKLSDENKGSINDCFKKAKQIGIVNVFIFDSIDNVKKSEFEPWFKEGFNANDGIWIGNGFNDQFTFKSLIRSPELKEMIGDDFCIVLQKGRPSIVKYISDFNIKNLDEDDFIEEL